MCSFLIAGVQRHPKEDTVVIGNSKMFDPLISKPLDISRSNV